MSTEVRHDQIDTSQVSEFVALGGAVTLAVIIGVVFLGHQLAQVMSAIGAGLRV